MEYISLNWFEIPESFVLIMISLRLFANKEANEPRVTSDQVDVMTLLAIKEYLCHIIMTTNMFRLS
jgi:hypothetical protein